MLLMNRVGISVAIHKIVKSCDFSCVTWFCCRLLYKQIGTDGRKMERKGKELSNGVKEIAWKILQERKLSATCRKHWMCPRLQSQVLRSV